MTDVYIWWQRYRLYRAIAMIFTFIAAINSATDAGVRGLTGLSGVLSFIMALTAGGIFGLLAADWWQDRGQLRRRHAKHRKEEPADDGV